ncbi:ATP synthase F0 subunit A [Atopobacter sp. AH10]|nr:ATP synthase F0 subunit A [Atopobacter sp. AH10]
MHLSASANVVLASLGSVAIAFFVMFFLSRRISLVPGRRQALLEMIVDFTNKIVGSAMDEKLGLPYRFFTFVLFIYIAVNNIIGLSMIIVYKGFSFWGSPTANAIVCLGLSAMVILLSHYKAVEKFGFRAYFKNTFLSPMPGMFPIKLIEEFTNTLTLGLRLYGNIYAGEILLSLIAMFATSSGLTRGILAVPLAMIWMGFSTFIGFIQAFVFSTLSNVYISHKLEVEDD